MVGCADIGAHGQRNWHSARASSFVMSNENSLSIIIPAYNEAKRLPKTLAAIGAYLEQSVFRLHEVIIVDDGSSDATADIAQEYAQAARVRVVRARKNRGKGAALRLGVLLSQGQYVLITDADLSTPIRELGKLLTLVRRDGYDVAIGSRKVPESIITRQPLLRRLVGDAGNAVVRLVLGLPFRDTQCGFKLYRRAAALKLYRPLRLPRFSFDIEALVRARRLGLRVAEVGVRWEHADHSTVRTRDVVQSFFDVFRIRFGLGQSAPPQQLLRFISVGLINTMVDLTVYVFLTRLLASFAGEPVAAKFFSFLAATISSLLLNRRWTFGISSPLTLPEVVRFYTTVSASMGLNVTLMYLFVHVVGMYDLLAFVCATACTFGLNFMLSRHWVFRTAPATI